MSANTIRNALGVLQDDPDNEDAWGNLREALGFSPEEGTANPVDTGGLDVGQFLEAARKAHEMRREHEAVANLLEMEAALASGDRKVTLLSELGRVRDDLLFDDAGALSAYANVLAIRPEETDATEAVARIEAKRTKWKELGQRYVQEAKTAGDPSFKSSLLVSAAEIAYRYGGPREEEEAATPKSTRGKKKKNSRQAAKERSEKRRELVERTVKLLREAVTLDPKSRRGALLLERIYRDEDRWEELAKTLETFATEVTTKDEKLAALVRLARVCRRKLESVDRAVSAYERILDLAPAHPEATSALVDYFTEREMWDHLVSLYDGQLTGGGVRPGQEVGVIFQIAMVHWRMRAKPEAAERYFERLRRHEPAHPGMLGFFREWCRSRNETARLVQILTEAQRSLPDGRERAELAGEIAQLAEEGANAQKAIEQWRALLRSDPTNTSARESLKRLYKQTGAYNHLADLLRLELERVPQDASRLPLLREIAQIYREHIKSDSALVTVLSQIIALDARDADAVRELARVYESLGRWRDLLTTQMRLAELEPDAQTKAELYRAIARRWLEQFSNVQNAVEAYEKLREAAPDDDEALEKLRELYTKRRSYRQLYELFEADAKRKEGVERRTLWIEMAKMAADRLDRGADAIRLYKMVLEEDPHDTASLDALEKQADRDKDFATVAEVLERRVELTEDPTARLAVLQKLGGVYADRLKDHGGALRVWRRVLELSPGHAKAMRILRDSYLAMADYDGLTELYAQSEDWEGLVEVLSTTADRATDPEAKVELSFRTASILEEKLGAAERAFRSYERVLSVRPDDVRAATALVPLYEHDEKWARLPPLYEVLAAHASDDADRIDLYRRLADVTGHRLSDRGAAFRYARKLFELAPEDPQSLVQLEGWARAAGEWTSFVDALEARLKSSSIAPSERRALQLRLAEVSATHAGRPEDAIAAYRAIVEADEADEATIAALDRLLRTTPGREEELRWLFRFRVERVSEDERVHLLSSWAVLEEDAFGAPERAASLYRELLEIVPNDARALRALARLLLAAGDAAGAVAILERERDAQDGAARVARELEIARLYIGPLTKPTEALACAERALEVAPNDLAVIALLEELLALPETRARTAVVLEQAYASMGAYPKQADVLGVLLGAATAKEERIELYGRLADVKQRLGDHGGAFQVIAKASEEYPGELAIWDRLASLASKTHQMQAFVDAIARVLPEQGDTGLPPDVEIDLAERAATLYDEMLGDIDRAVPFLNRILARDLGNERAFVRLKQILTTRENWNELEALYERVLAASDDAARRIDLLAEVAIVAEEITGDANKAIHYYERILELEPGQDQAIYALDKLYASLERWQDLVLLLQRRLELVASDTDTTQLKQRLGILLFTRLADPSAALGYLEDVVRADSSIREARDLVERCLSHPDLRQRAAAVLEGVYTEREETRDLVRILEVRLEPVPEGEERRDLLRRIAELKDERLTDDRGAFETYGQLLPLSPEDLDARQRYLEIGRRLDRLGEAAEVLLTTARKADAPQPRAEILQDVARIFDQRGEADRAEAVYKEILELASDDAAIALPAARSLEQIYAVRGRSRELAEVLRTQVKLEDRSDVKRELLGRLGRISERELSDDAGAIAAWKARLEDDPADDEALSALDRLYERGADHRALVEILRMRERHATDGAARKTFMLRAAQILADRAFDIEDAMLAYRAVLDDFGPERPLLAALGALYEKSERYPDLADTIEGELALAAEGGTPDADRVALLVRLGDVRRKKLGEVGSALESYREALTFDPNNGPARSALEELLEDENVRSEAAEVLRPLYEENGEHAPLVRVLDIQIAAENDPELRLRLLARAASETEGPLGDPVKAFAYVARGLREAAADADLSSWLERAERLAVGSGNHAELVQLYRDVAPEVPDEDKQLGIFLRIAEIARTRLSDSALAKEYYRAALDVRPDEARALLALEQLYEEAAEYEKLLEILSRRADNAEGDSKRTILYKQARICDEFLQDRDRAIKFYEDILDLSFDAPAVSALERLYTAAGRWGDLVALHERELGTGDATPERRAVLHHALGNTLERHLGEIDRAFDEYAEALREDAQHAPTIEALEHLMTQRAHAGRAAEMLEAVYLARLDWRRVMSAIDARLSASEDPEERRTLLRRLAKLHEEQEEDYRAALEITAKLLAEDLSDESTWAELERLARVANAEGRLAEIYAGELDKITSDEPHTARLAQRAGELFERDGDVDRALTLFRRAYRFSPEEEQKSFTAIDRLLSRAGRPAERVALYREALDYRTDLPERVGTLHAIAAIEEGELSDEEAAIATYRSIVDADETDAKALDALARLLAKKEDWRELADLHRRRAEQSALPDDEAKWRLELARVLDTRESDTLGALDELESVIRLVSPTETETGRSAVALLEKMLSREEYRPRVVELLNPIYEQADDWRKLVDVARHRLEVADTPAEKVSVLRDTARLLEERGKDLDRAFDCLTQAFVLDPDDGETREQLDRLAVATERWDDLADAYEAGIAKIEGVGQRELIEALARLHDSRRDDPRRALQAWERLFGMDETEERPLDAMDELATLLGDWTTLVRVLAKRGELERDDEARAALWRRIGQVRRDMLDDTQAAIEAFERALELEPQSALSVDKLIELYEEQNDAGRLVDLYRRRVEMCEDGDTDKKHALLLAAARAYEVGLGDRREAIALLGQALVMKADDVEVMDRLAALFEAEKMWPDLLDNLRHQVETTDDPARRASITKRIARILAAELDDHEKALAAYREVLSTAYDDEAAVAVRDLGEQREELRREATAILEPILRENQKHALLVEVLELRLRSETDPAERAATRRQIAQIAESSLGDLRKAEEALALAITERPEDSSLHEEVERLAALLGREGWARYADVLAERAAAILDAKVNADLLLRLGRVAEAQLSDPRRAAEAYARAAEQGGDTVEVLSSLERVYGTLEDTTALLGVIERRIAIETGEEAQADLYHRLASLQLGPIGDKTKGLATLKLALERAPSHEKSRASVEELLSDDDLFEEAFHTLEGVYRSTDRGADLGRLYGRRVERAEGGRGKTRARLQLAKVLENEGKDAVAAQRAVEEALENDPQDAEVLAELERLADKNDRWESAASALARALDAAGTSGAISELWARLGRWRRDKVKDAGAAEAAFRRALEGDSDNADLVRAVEELTRAPGRERDRIAVLRQLAHLEPDLDKKRELAREAVGLAEGVVADPAIAEAILRELLAENDGDAWAAEELTRLRQAAGDHAEVVKLLLSRAKLAADPEVGLDLRHRAAAVAADELHDRERAIELYEEIREQSATDERARERLRALYAELGMFGKLVKLLTALVGTTPPSAERSALRLDLARLQLEKFDASKEAVEILRAILDEDPDHAEAARMLTEIYENTNANAELAALWTRLVERAKERGDAALELSHMLRLGEILEHRVKDNARALVVYQGVLERDSTHRGALEAVARLAEQVGRWEEAGTALGSLVETASGPQAVELCLRLARAKEETGDASGVQRALERALEHDRTNGEVRSRLVELHEKTKNWADLAALLLGNADLLREEYGEYVPPAAPTSGVSLPPGPSGPPGSVAPPGHVAEEVRLLRRAADIHVLERKQPGDAVPILERASKLVPQDRELLLTLCDAYTASNRQRDAAAVLEKVIASFGNKRTKELSVYHHRLGRALASLGDKDVALTQLDMAFKIDPGSVEVLRDLGVLALETNDLERAQKTFRALLLQRLDAKSGISKGEVFYYLGEISMKQGDKAKAVQMLERAVENEPTLDRAKAMLSDLKG